MWYRRSINLSWLVLAIVVLSLVTLQAEAQPDIPPLPPIDESLAQPATPPPPQMSFSPPVDADSLADFAPPETAVSHLDAISTGKSATPFNASQNNLITFSQDQVAIYIEEQTFSSTVTLEYTDLMTYTTPVATQNIASLPITTTSPLTAALPTDPFTFLHFQLDVVTIDSQQAGSASASFNMPVRLIIDMRRYTQDFDPSGGEFYLAYRDPQEPQVWHDVPVWLHQSDGLLSAEVTHFSEWTAGWRPQSWTPLWTPPSVSAFSGAATYSYAIDVPPGRNGLQPSVTLSYNSRQLDGAIFQVGHGPVATGWSLADIYIAREGVKIDYSSGYKLVHPDRFRLVLNGVGYELVPEGSTTGDTVRYYAKNMPGLRIDRIYNAATPNQEGIYWLVRTADGTEYRLGYTADSEEWQKLISSGSLDLSGHRGRNATGDEQNTSAVGWYVDTIKDTYNNQIVYTYNHRSVVKYACNRGDTCSSALKHEHHKLRLATISYNFNTSGVPATQIAFHARGYTDIWGNWQENQMGYIQNILIYHGNVNGNPIKEYRLESQTDRIDPAVVDCPSRSGNNPESRTTRILTQIQEWAGTDRNYHNQNDSGAYALPAVTFGYEIKPHFFQYNDANRPCFSFKYLNEVKNGYGGSTKFEYTSDGRSEGEYRVLSYFNIYWPGVGFNYFVSKQINNDGRNANAVIDYNYYQPCYGQKWGGVVGSMPDAFTCAYADASLMPQHGNIVGFARTTQTTRGYGGELLTRQVSDFHQDELRRGQPYQVDGGVPDANSLAIATLLTRSQTLPNHLLWPCCAFHLCQRNYLNPIQRRKQPVNACG